MAKAKAKSKSKRSGRDERGRIAPGNSGNPSGRPKGAKTFGPSIIAAAAEALEILVQKKTPIAALIARDLTNNDTRNQTLKALSSYLPKEVNVSGSMDVRFSEMTDDELQKAIVEKITKLGLVK